MDVCESNGSSVPISDYQPADHHGAGAALAVPCMPGKPFITMSYTDVSAVQYHSDNILQVSGSYKS
jgi:hypothetical protein